jgi:hypothetical protein
MDWYYNRIDPSSVDISDEFRESLSNFAELLIGVEESISIRRYYRVGDEMRAQYAPGDGSITLKNSFPFPRIGNFGQCDNFKAMRFFEQSETVCNQPVNLLTDCTANSLSFLNVQLYELLELFVDNERTNNKVKV